MANKTGLQFVSYSDIFWFVRMNKRPEADYGSPEELKAIDASMALSGWIDREIVNCFELTPELQKEAHDTITAKLAELETLAKTSVDTQPLATIYRQLHCDSKGKVITPRFGGNMCFRRGVNYPQAMVMRVFGKVGEKLDLVDQIPVNVKVYATEIDRIMDQTIENEKAGIGKKSLSDLTRLDIAHDMFDALMPQIKFRQTFKDGTGQKLHAFLSLNNKYPELKLYDRVRLPEKDPQYIPLSKLGKEEMRLTAEANETADNVTVMLTDWLKGKKNATKIMETKKIREAHTRYDKNLLALRIFGGIVSDNTHAFIVLKDDEVTFLCNAVEGAIGKPELMKALVQAVGTVLEKAAAKAVAKKSEAEMVDAGAPKGGKGHSKK